MTGEDAYVNIPQELRGRKQWVCWRNEIRGGKKTKVPYRTPSSGGGRARIDDPSTWHTFVDVLRAVRQTSANLGGLMYALTEADPFTFIDLDHAVENGAIRPWALHIIRRFASYTEYSPSGAGLHLLVGGKKPGSRCRTSRFRRIEVYDRRRFITFTGAVLPGYPLRIVEAQSTITELYTRVFGVDPSKAEPICYGNELGLDLPDEVILRKAMSARNGGKFRRLWTGDTGDYNGDHSAADLGLCCAISFWTGPDIPRIDRFFRNSGLMREKWDEKRGNQTYGAMTIRRAISGTTVPHRSSSTGEVPDRGT